MRKKSKEPFIPAERQKTIRKEIISVLEGRTLSAKEISGEVGVSEKEVYEHLQHILKTHKRDYALKISPAECKKCSFVFRKRDKLKKPGRCPICRSESILDPFFSLGIAQKSLLQ